MQNAAPNVSSLRCFEVSPNGKQENKKKAILLLKNKHDFTQSKSQNSDCCIYKECCHKVSTTDSTMSSYQVEVDASSSKYG